ncbi:MAG: CPBP family intramembrane metalloprotease [Oscillospiraceae bacterium]|nr:CPBP family intramembrane metalloprotease [Oscillospiraceae bacterium]
MRHKEFDKSRVVKYLVWTFALAYLIQFGVGLLYQRGNMMIGQLVMAGMMFVPMLGVLLSGGKLSGMGWRLQIKKNIKAILIGWFVPAVLTAIGAALYFIIFPGHFDLSGSSMGPDALEQLQVQGISYPMYVLISLVSSLTYAPLLNTFVSLGEEIGWRGFLYPQLRAKLGREKGWLLGGIIWGAWHWPLIGLIGYEYGTEYFGFPVVGMLVFCVFTIAMGILCDWLYEQSGSIWVPSICHGAINAAGTLPLAICLPNTGSARLLGPMPNGLIAGLPILITAVLLGRKEPSTENS